jgi:hypothetical protein
MSDDYWAKCHSTLRCVVDEAPWAPVGSNFLLNVGWTHIVSNMNVSQCRISSHCYLYQA